MHSDRFAMPAQAFERPSTRDDQIGDRLHEVELRSRDQRGLGQRQRLRRPAAEHRHPRQFRLKLHGEGFPAGFRQGRQRALQDLGRVVQLPIDRQRLPEERRGARSRNAILEGRVALGGRGRCLARTTPLPRQLFGARDVLKEACRVAGMVAVRKFYTSVGIVNLAAYNDRTVRATATLGALGLPLTLLLNRAGAEIGRFIGPAEWDDPNMVAFIAGRVKAEPPEGGKATTIQLPE